MKPEELIAKATNFHFWGLDSTHAFDLEVVKRDTDRWAVSWSITYCYDNEKGDFVFEPSPSNRTDEFCLNTRFDLDKAIEIASRFAFSFQNQYDQWKASQAPKRTPSFVARVSDLYMQLKNDSWLYSADHPSVSRLYSENFPVHKVRISEDPKGTYWAWWNNETSEFRHVYPSKEQVELCFHQGLDVPTRKGEGSLCQVSIEDFGEIDLKTWNEPDAKKS